VSREKCSIFNLVNEGVQKNILIHPIEQEMGYGYVSNKEGKISRQWLEEGTYEIGTPTSTQPAFSSIPR
jgi:hypothetical protein